MPCLNIYVSRVCSLLCFVQSIYAFDFNLKQPSKIKLEKNILHCLIFINFEYDNALVGWK